MLPLKPKDFGIKEGSLHRTKGADALKEKRKRGKKGFQQKVCKKKDH